MQELRANTSVKVKIGPFVDFSDGLTPESTLVLSTADEAELFKHDASAVTDISANTWAAITGCDGWYNLTLTTDDTNTEGLLDIIVQDDSVCLPVHARLMVLSEAAWDSKYVAKDDGYMDVNVKAISEDTDAADNAEKVFDNTGYNMSSTTIGSITSVINSVTVSDKTGFSLSTDGILAIWHQLLDAITTASTIGKLIKDYLNASVSSRSSHSAADAGTDAASKVLATPAQKLVTDSNGKVTVGTNSDKTGYSLSTTPPTAADIKTAMEADGSKLDHLWEMTEDDSGTRRLTTNALENAPTGGGSGPRIE